MEENKDNSAVNSYQIDNPFKLGNYGWVCPKCGRVYSPFMHMCIYCGGIQDPNIQYSETWSSNNIEINTK